MKKTILTVILALSLAACAPSNGGYNPAPPFAPLPPDGQRMADDTVVRAQAFIQVTSDQTLALFKFLQKFFSPTAYAATGSVVVTYTNAAAVSFTINAASLTAGAFTGTTLSLGSVALATLDDNSLKVCNPGGNTKCTQGIIRVYTTGSVAGFVQTTDLYGAPVYAGSLNPSSAVGLTSANSVQVQTVTIAANKNRLRIADFTSPTYGVTSDFSNAGSGPYSMTFVVEYALAP